MRYLPLLIASLPLFALAAENKTATSEKSRDSTELIRTLYEGSNFKPYPDKAAWQKRATYLREQVLISAGLWPMPEKSPLNAVIHGRIDRDEYTIEKVYFESYPGFYVTGNLYRPKGKIGPFPAILSPHGHWNNGRLYEAPDNEVKNQIANGWEKDPDAARYSLQARCASLAKLGCIVFFYDMVGFADSDPEHFPHRATYLDLDSNLHGLSVFGLQTWDSIRSLDFLESLPDVDRKRIAITGASGGGTQTFVMMTIDDRLAAAAPVNMISAGDHQGGCVCENNSLLRIGTDNVELAATFAPKPFIHPTATGDWTKDFLEKGFPEIQATYKLFGAEANVESMRQKAPHNYNLHAREAVYNFFNKHLKLGHEGIITEPKFVPVKPEDLSVWDAKHPRPKNAVDAAGFKKWWVQMTARQIEAMNPKNGNVQEVRWFFREVLLHLNGGELAPSATWVVDSSDKVSRDEDAIVRHIIYSGADSVSTVSFSPKPNESKKDNTEKSTVILVLPNGSRDALDPNGSSQSLIASLISDGHRVIVPDIAGDEKAWQRAVIGKNPVEFPAGYNPTPFARYVRNVAITIEAVCSQSKSVDLVGIGEAGPWCVFARVLYPDTKDKFVARSIVDANFFKFETSPNPADGGFLPLILRYGGLQTFASMGQGGNRIFNVPADVHLTWIDQKHFEPKASEYIRIEKDAKPEDIVHWLSR